MWGHVIEKVVEKLDFSQKPGSPEGSKIQKNGSKKNFVLTGASGRP
jgi:hypothetical protein